MLIWFTVIRMEKHQEEGMCENDFYLINAETVLRPKSVLFCIFLSFLFLAPTFFHSLFFSFIYSSSLSLSSCFPCNGPFFVLIAASPLHCSSSIMLRTVFISFNNIFKSAFWILTWCVTFVSTPFTNSFRSLNEILAQPIASAGISYDISINSFTVKLFSFKYCWITSFCSLSTRAIATEFSGGNPNCCSSVAKIVSVVWNRHALINKNRMHAMAAFIDFTSFLFEMKVFNFSSYRNGKERHTQ